MRIIADKADLALFLKTGIVTLSIIGILFSGIKYFPKTVTVTSHTNARKIPISSVETNEKVLALTFDIDGKTDDLGVILDILDKYNLKVTFFITGKWLDSNPKELEYMVNAGHDIGNHSNSHKHMDLASEGTCKEEILTLHNRLREMTGIEMTLFRPPYGDFNNTIIHTAKELGYETIKWDIDSNDWKDYSSEEIIKQTTDKQNLKNGSIILLRSGTKFTSESLEQIIINLTKQGYEILPVSKLIHTENYILDETGRQFLK